MPASAVTTAAARSRASLALLKHGGMMLVVALCKAGLLLAMLECSGVAVESTAEIAECLDIELANPTEGQGTSLRSLQSRSHIVGALRRDPGATGSRRLDHATGYARRDGHRLSNGLLAPRLC
jgi:hypothetical protein